jgi:hypothetical protein
MSYSARPWMAVPALAVGALLLTGANAFAADTATIYNVTQEGMTAADGQKLADAYGIENSVAANGAFSYTGKGFGAVPHKRVDAGKDESGRPTVSEALDTKALQSLRPLSDDAALRRAAALPALAGLGGDFKAEPSLSHSELTTANADGKATGKYALDTSVSYNLTLGGLPVTGQGAKLRVTLAGDGSVTQISSSLRRLEAGKQASIISPSEAAKACSALYAPDVRQAAPTLGYLLPALSAQDASGKGSVQQIFPAYTCNPVGGKGTQAHRQVAAVQGASPEATFKASLRDGVVSGAADVSGGTAPYSYKWASSTTVIDGNTDAKVSYKRAPRDGKLTGEGLTLEVTDANGLSSTATGLFEGDGEISAVSTAGGGGFGKLTSVGIEQTVDEWQCAQDSAIGFKNVMASKGVSTAFDFRGMGAWEEDFKKTSAGGNDNSYADSVDAMWYTGHGWSGGFTFKNTTHDDDAIVPSDADWGNYNLEWLQLESCQVLRDTNGSNDYFGRWGQAINGLHMLNGFHTNAYCVGGGTGGRFADYLFPYKIFGITIRPALTVRNAWAQMAFDKEPNGVVFRSMGNIGPGGVTNINDYFWGQGATGPDISKASRTGMWAIAQTV